MRIFISLCLPIVRSLIILGQHSRINVYRLLKCLLISSYTRRFGVRLPTNTSCKFSSRCSSSTSAFVSRYNVFCPLTQLLLQARPEDQLLSAHQSRSVLPPRPRLLARFRVPEEAIRYLLRHRQRVPRIPHPIQRRRSRWYSIGSFEEQGVSSPSTTAVNKSLINFLRTYSINQRQLFDENYGLASTQSLKNKDIPEGGAKGTILPSLGAQPKVCFEKYVDVCTSLSTSHAWIEQFG